MVTELPAQVGRWCEWFSVSICVYMSVLRRIGAFISEIMSKSLLVFLNLTNVKKCNKCTDNVTHRCKNLLQGCSASLRRAEHWRSTETHFLTLILSLWFCNSCETWFNQFLTTTTDHSVSNLHACFHFHPTPVFIKLLLLVPCIVSPLHILSLDLLLITFNTLLSWLCLIYWLILIDAVKFAISVPEEDLFAFRILKIILTLAKIQFCDFTPCQKWWLELRFVQANLFYQTKLGKCVFKQLSLCMCLLLRPEISPDQNHTNVPHVKRVHVRLTMILSQKQQVHYQKGISQKSQRFLLSCFSLARVSVFSLKSWTEWYKLNLCE